MFYGNGTKIGSEFLANSYTTGYQQFSSVASFNNGNFVVTWVSNVQDGSSYGIFGQIFSGNGTKIGSEFRANSYTTSYQQLPSVVSLADGNFIVTWESDGQDDSGSGVYGQIFNDTITYPPSSTTTSSSTTSTTKTTSTQLIWFSKKSVSTTPSVSSSITSTTKTTSPATPSVSSSTTSTTTSSTTSSVSSRIMSDTSDLKKRFSWVWFLLGGVGAVSCLGLMGYFILKYRDRKKDGNGTFELTDALIPRAIL